MGGCATKPKVSKGEEGGAPQPGPEHPEKEETVAAVAKDVAVVDHGEKELKGDVGGDHDVAKVKEIVEDNKADDQESKPRSLSNLFKTEGGQDPTKADNAPSEPVKEESEEPGKPKEDPETKQPEVEKTVIPVEKAAAQEFVDAPEKPLAEKATEGGQDPTKADNAPSEPVKEESEEPGKPIEEPETKQPEVEETVIPVEQTAAQEFVDAPEKPLAEKATDVTLAEETKTEDAKSSETKTEGAQSPGKKTEEVKTEDNIKDSEPADEKITEKLSEVPT